MKENALVSNYTVAQYRVHATSCNESATLNIVDREFDDRAKLEVAVSDLTYVRVGNKWNYVCTIIDLYNREIIGYAAGANKNKDGKAYENLYESAKARAEADWIVGINATRELTTKYNSQLSCGRVQTPTLAIIAQRQEEIKNFVPRDY